MSKTQEILKRGTPVKSSGYEGTIIRHYDGGMYDIRLPGGVCCTDDFEVLPQSTPNKTMAGWNESKLSLTKYLCVGDIVDEEIYDYILCVLPPAFHDNEFLQMGEPYDHNEHGETFITLQKCVSGWVYAGTMNIVNRSVDPEQLSGVGDQHRPTLKVNTRADRKVRQLWTDNEGDYKNRIAFPASRFLQRDDITIWNKSSSKAVFENGNWKVNKRGRYSQTR